MRRGRNTVIAESDTRRLRCGAALVVVIGSTDDF